MDLDTGTIRMLALLAAQRDDRLNRAEELLRVVPDEDEDTDSAE